MAATTMESAIPAPRGSDSRMLSTLLDSQNHMARSDTYKSDSTSPFHHPDLSNEVAALSHKLISAINHQTDLDDTLAITRHELDTAKRQIRQLESNAKAHETMLLNGELWRKEEVEAQKLQLMANLALEQKQRGVMEKDKRGMEQELESLTTALFEEANQVRSGASFWGGGFID